MGEVIPFKSEKDLFIERLLIALHDMTLLAEAYKELYERADQGENVILANPMDVAITIAKTNDLIQELRRKNYGKLLDRFLDS